MISDRFHIGLAHIGEHPPSIIVLLGQLLELFNSFQAVIGVHVVEPVGQFLEQGYYIFVRDRVLGIWLLAPTMLFLRTRPPVVVMLLGWALRIFWLFSAYYYFLRL